MSKEKSEDEIRNKFLSHVRSLVKYWESVEDKNCEEKLSGLAFSILSAIDGCSVDLCGFILAPCPHEDEKQSDKFFKAGALMSVGGLAICVLSGEVFK